MLSMKKTAMAKVINELYKPIPSLLNSDLFIRK